MARLQIFSSFFILCILTSCGSLVPENLVSKDFFPSRGDIRRDFFRVAWSKNFDVPYQTGNLPISFNSPVIHRGVLLASSPNGTMKAYNAKTGHVLWSHQDHSSFSSSPAVHDEMLFYGSTSGRLYARNYRTGKLIYEVDVGGGVDSSAVVANGRLFLHLRNHTLVSLDAKTGKILWSYKRSVAQTTTVQRVSVPLVDKLSNKLYVGMADGHIVAFRMEDGVILWEKKIVYGQKFIDVDSAPVLYDGKLYVGSFSGDLMVLSPSSGVVLQRIPLNVSRSPLFYKNHMYVGLSSGEIIKATPLGRVLARRKTSKEEGNITNLKIWKKGHLVATNTNGEIFYIHKDSLETLQRRHLGSGLSAIYGNLAQEKDFLAVFSSRNRLYVFK